MDADLGDLTAFLAVAKARGFRDAARTSGTSASTLSEAVRRLETRLGVRLLHRTTRSVTPTEAGAQLIDRLTPALGEVDAALDAVGDFREGTGGSLRLNVPVSAARLVLPAILPGFLAAHPGIRLEIVAQDSFVDVLAAGCDAGIRYDERLEQDMTALPIGPRVQRMATAAAPSYLDRHGRPDHPRDLLEHACLLGRFASGALTSPWEFECASEIVRVEPRGRLSCRSAVQPILRSTPPSPAVGSSRYSRIGCARISTAAHWSRCCKNGGSRFPAPSSTILTVDWCRPRCAPSSTLSGRCPLRCARELT